MKTIFGALALALIVAGCGDDGAGNGSGMANLSAPLTPIAAPNNGDWTQTVTETPQGYRMGNPDAPVKLVEYASISCPHCGEFSRTAASRLQDVYVRSGQVSWEYRPFMLPFPTDPGTFALLRCQGATPFFRLVEQLYAVQPEWLERAQAASAELQQQVQALPPTGQAAAWVRAAGLDQFFRQRGMPEARINACLADQGTLERLADMTSRGAEQDQVQGTPTFFVNGERVDVAEWGPLEQRLRDEIGN